MKARTNRTIFNPKWFRYYRDEVVATAWATVAAVVLGCAQPAPALTTPVPPTLLAAPVSADEGERHGGGGASAPPPETGPAPGAATRGDPGVPPPPETTGGLGWGGAEAVSKSP